jgi:hypothetical protein
MEREELLTHLPSGFRTLGPRVDALQRLEQEVAGRLEGYILKLGYDLGDFRDMASVLAKLATPPPHLVPEAAVIRSLRSALVDGIDALIRDSAPLLDPAQDEPHVNARLDSEEAKTLEALRGELDRWAERWRSTT